MLERARPVRPGANTDDIFYQNYGGVAVVASSAVRLSKISAPFEPITFEHLIARVTVSGSSHIFAVVYRPGSAKVTAAFFDELRLLLEFLSSFAMPYVITGYLNIGFDRPEDLMTLRATQLMDTFDAVQSIKSTTQDRGGSLTSSSLELTIRRRWSMSSVFQGTRMTIGLVTWPFVAAPAETPVY